MGVEAHSYDFDRKLLHTLERDKVVVALPALHGQLGEDGEIQTLLELIGMPYVGSRSHACRVAYDKGTARELLRRAGIPVPDSVGLSAQTFRDIGAAALMEHVMHRLGTRVVVKPTRGGSALGISGVDGLGALPSALVETYAYCEDALIERFHDGVDVSVVVLETDDGLTLADADRDRVREGPRVRLQRPLHRRVRLPRPARPARGAARPARRGRPRRAPRARPARRLPLRLHRHDDGSFVVLETAITPGATETSVFPFAARSAAPRWAGRPRPAAARAAQRRAAESAG